MFEGERKTVDLTRMAECVALRLAACCLSDLLIEAEIDGDMGLERDRQPPSSSKFDDFTSANWSDLKIIADSSTFPNRFKKGYLSSEPRLSSL